jgi:TolB-like protein/tRNA A-37 threonylcarbamoyl transferase component Bud32/cytochrome c-type biogenesis protein CcmH/NrfG
MQPALPQDSTCPNCGGLLEKTPSGGLGCPSCLLRAGIGSEEETLHDSMPDAVEGGLRFGVYEIDCREDGRLYELGSGAMGVTYRATDTSLQRKVALKIIKIDIAERSPDARERFMREARAAAALRHENIATVYQFGMRLETGQYFYAMELIEGETLDERVHRAGPLDARTTIDIAQQVTSALAAAENHGLVHRDLKPANLMLVSPDGETSNNKKLVVKIIDFGLAKAIHTQTDPKSLTHDMFVGTPAFASPEQFDHSALDVRSDIYSLGETLWFALTGKIPFAGHTLSEIHRAQKSSVLPLEQLKAAHVPSGLRSLLESMLAFEPASRPGTHELAARLHRCSEKRSFFTELKRRNVYKVAVAYAVAAWLLIQAASILFPTFDAPPWLMQIFVVILVIGFPAALVFSWAFEITPEGIVRESEVEQGKPITRRTGRKIVAMTVVLAIFAAGLLIFQVLRARSTMARQSEAATAIPEKSIAVLPFENRSDDKANAYFADGIQDEILTRLANIADLKVISRTSTRQYQSKPANLREIAKQLGVANILEGSVQKVADQVRVNVQLINAQTDSHLWADIYDRKLTDIFSVESDIARRIAESLQAKLTGREEKALAVKPTNNPEAYDAYLRGLAFEARYSSSYSPDLIRKAMAFYERAVQLDPNFALAWARLSRANGRIYFGCDDTTCIARREAAKRALENAQKLEPNSPETLLALGYYQYHALRDYGAAKTTFERISNLLPGSSEVPYALAVATRRKGQWDQSVAYWERALALDPRNMELLMPAAETYDILRQFPAALRLYDRALDITPNDLDVIAAKAGVYQAQGDLHEAARLLSGINEKTSSNNSVFSKITQLRLERRNTEAIRLLQARLAQFHFDSEFSKGFYQLWLAFIQRLAGDRAGAKITAEQARNTLDQFYRNQPDSAYLARLLSLANAALGEKEAALKEAERAIMLEPRAQDAISGPGFEENLALIQTIFGENSRAIQTLTQLLQTPYMEGGIYGMPITPALLRFDPIWDPLRSDPAFQKLCEEKQP